MSANRRTFVKLMAATGGALALSRTRPLFATPPVGRAAEPLRILILGGTGFIGPNQVKYAVARGHKVTVFNRGRSQGEIPDEVERLYGDRNGQLDALKGRDWDVVIDNPTTLPRWVRDAAQILQGHARQDLFISTLSVYASWAKPNMDETAPVAQLEDPASEDTRKDYGPLKALAEQEAEKWFPGKTTVIRPGLIVGPEDPSDRFTYWPVRVARGGEVLAPGKPSDPVQIIDARDLAEFCIRMVEQGDVGTYNAVGPRSPFTMGEMLAGIRAVLPASLDIRWTWADADFLAAQKVRPWSDMPVWIPTAGEYAGWSQANTDRALAKGITFRPFAQTAFDTLEWHQTRPAAEQEKMRAGLPAEREAEVLAAWHARTPS
jgi:2'-hydroxyisoflavone reductase